MRKLLNNFTRNYVVKYLKKVPGERQFGPYRFLPLFFFIGASIEFLMINLTVGPRKVNFCNKKLSILSLTLLINHNFYSTQKDTTLKRRQAAEVLDQKEKLESYFIDAEKKL